MAGPETTVWCQRMNDKKQFIGGLFFVEASSNFRMADLANKIKDGGGSQMENVDLSELVMWKWPGGVGVKPPDEQIRDFEQKGVKLRPPHTLSDLQWSRNFDVPAVQIPRHVAPAGVLPYERFQPLSEVPEKYQNVVMKMTLRRMFLNVDPRSNNIRQSTSADVPFVVKFKKMLERPRTVGQGAFPTCEDDNFSTGTSSTTKARMDVHTKLMQVLRIEPDAVEFDVNDEEVAHLRNLAFFDTFGDADKSRTCNEDIANAIIFFPFKHRLDSFVDNDITFGFGDNNWPLHLWTQILGKAEAQVNEQLFTYRPKSNFVVLKGNVPRLVVEVESHTYDILKQDWNRMLVQSGSIVRFANTHLDGYRGEKNFVLVAVYIHDSGLAERFLLYQERGSDTVYRTTEEFTLLEDVDRLKFTRELYNLASSLAQEDTGNSEEEINELNQTVQRLERNFELKDFAGHTKCPDSQGEDSDDYNTCSGRSAANRLSDGEAIDELARHGYKVKPSAFEDVRGCLWEAVVKLPPNLRTVYRASDVKKTELIAKKVRKRSNMNENELQILQYLHTNRPPSPHVIEFMDSIVTTTDTWIIFPKLYTIADQLEFNGGRSLRGKVEQLSWGLIKGLAYLHKSGIAHLDIKPDDLVCDDSHQLKIVDFDVAVRVKDEDEAIEGYRGTRGWTAPEVGEEDGPAARYSPIKADRWSCGRVLLSFLKIEGQNRVLSAVADAKLTSSDPHKRPSLFEWHKWREAAGSKPSRTDVSDLDGRGVRRLRQGVTDEDELQAQAPVAKRPKLGL